MGPNVMLAALAGLLLVVGIVSSHRQVKLFFSLLCIIPPGGTSPSLRHDSPAQCAGLSLFPGRYGRKEKLPISFRVFLWYNRRRTAAA